MAGRLRETLGINEITSKKTSIWKALLAEFVGNVLLNFFGCASCVTVNSAAAQHGPNFVLVALTFGFTVFIVVQALGHVSGAHINPAITAGMMATQNTSIIKGLLYIIVQCLGALAGSGILKAATPEVFHITHLGNTELNPAVSPAQGLLIEFLLGFVLTLTVFGVCDPNRYEAKAAGALAIGIAVSLGHLATVDYTGSGMNPARSFGSAVIADYWVHHWIYWVGPILGGIAAGLLYKYAFSAPSTGPLKIIERYTAVVTDEKELKRLDGSKHDINLS